MKTEPGVWITPLILYTHLRQTTVGRTRLDPWTRVETKVTAENVWTRLDFRHLQHVLTSYSKSLVFDQVVGQCCLYRPSNRQICGDTLCLILKDVKVNKISFHCHCLSDIGPMFLAQQPTLCPWKESLKDITILSPGRFSDLGLKAFLTLCPNLESLFIQNANGITGEGLFDVPARKLQRLGFHDCASLDPRLLLLLATRKREAWEQDREGKEIEGEAEEREEKQHKAILPCLDVLQIINCPLIPAAVWQQTFSRACPFLRIQVDPDAASEVFAVGVQQLLGQGGGDNEPMMMIQPNPTFLPRGAVPIHPSSWLERQGPIRNERDVQASEANPMSWRYYYVRGTRFLCQAGRFCWDQFIPAKLRPGLQAVSDRAVTQITQEWDKIEMPWKDWTSKECGDIYWTIVFVLCCIAFYRLISMDSSAPPAPADPSPPSLTHHDSHCPKRRTLN